jgi:hypothetical protein
VSRCDGCCLPGCLLLLSLLDVDGCELLTPLVALLLRRLVSRTSKSEKG